ncbi:hypothetical protein CBR_g70729 [Chara braunii]|uniref:RING-type domain-containing protein n=1 Tax=Chara braunii TaxID=69332 RepID=A0A388K9W3_CHABU|nr:hypothetical protein CBR_g70729 [Chara braunii]|eukprot:GBG66852.1 hypothetical protein CBR_g70729 [Chara braunii]
MVGVNKLTRGGGRLIPMQGMQRNDERVPTKLPPAFGVSFNLSCWVQHEGAGTGSGSRPQQQPAARKRAKESCNNSDSNRRYCCSRNIKNQTKMTRSSISDTRIATRQQRASQHRLQIRTGAAPVASPARPATRLNRLRWRRKRTVARAVRLARQSRNAQPEGLPNGDSVATVEPTPRSTTTTVSSATPRNSSAAVRSSCRVRTRTATTALQGAGVTGTSVAFKGPGFTFRLTSSGTGTATTNVSDMSPIGAPRNVDLGRPSRPIDVDNEDDMWQIRSSRMTQSRLRSGVRFTPVCIYPPSAFRRRVRFLSANMHTGISSGMSLPVAVAIDVQGLQTPNLSGPIDLSSPSSSDQNGSLNDCFIIKQRPAFAKRRVLDSSSGVNTGIEVVGYDSAEPENNVSEEGAERSVQSILCNVCMEALKDATSTNCGHIFCRLCITEAIKAQKKCPTCRKRLTAAQTHRIYI